MSPQEELTWMNVIVRVGLNAVTHPVEYAKVLIQIGHEPLDPYQSRTIFGREKMFYPSVFKYISHIKQSDGFTGCYRGLSAKLVGNIISGLAFQHVSDNIKFRNLDDKDEKAEELTIKQRTQRFLQNTLRETAGRSAAIILSQPFHVIAIRTMAEFVGEDGKHISIVASIAVVYKEEGFQGFFSGLIPRMLCDIGALWIGNAIIHIVNNYVVEDKDIKSYVRASVRFMASALMYPLQVVSNCMAVNNCGIIAGSPPKMPHFDSWVDCYKHLRQIRGLKRGSSLLWRAYTGPLIMCNGPTIPTEAMFIPASKKFT